jgi:hypothetical protein
MLECNWRNYCDECLSNMTRAATCIHSFEDPALPRVGVLMGHAMSMAANAHDPWDDDDRPCFNQLFLRNMKRVRRVMIDRGFVASRYKLVSTHVHLDDKRRKGPLPFRRYELEEDEALAGVVIRLRYRGQRGCRGSRGTSFTVYLQACSLFRLVNE